MKVKGSTHNNLFFISDMLYGLCHDKTLVIDEETDLDIVFHLDEILKSELKVLVIKSKRVCPECGYTLKCNGTKEYLVNKKRKIHKQTYVCYNKEHQHYSTASTEKSIPKYSNYTYNIQKKGNKLEISGYKSYQEKAEIMNDYDNINISRSTVFKQSRKESLEFLGKLEYEDNQELKEQEIGYSGVYSYDEQYVFINNELLLQISANRRKYKTNNKR